MTRLKNCELKRAQPKLYAFCKANGWQVSATRKCHYLLRHPQAGTTVVGSTPSSSMAEIVALQTMRRLMRQANVEVKA